jgi:hypothetical protein
LRYLAADRMDMEPLVFLGVVHDSDMGFGTSFGAIADLVGVATGSVNRRLC